ncbi:MAG TPA: substrate-binding domain-containing protein [Roseiflexaceae bacterium]|nr:substrate-binding domain-containing protein [Roseiflexaceae bacterium]
MSGDVFRKVRSAERTLDLLELLAGSAEGLSFSQIGSALGLPKSSLSGLIRTLDARGYVAKTPDRRRFRLGPKIAELSAAIQPDGSVLEAATQAMRRLARQTGETAHVAVLEGASAVYVAVEESMHSMRMATAPGQRLPAHATAVGKCLLASLRDDTIARLLEQPLVARTPRTITAMPELRRELAHIRRLGYAYDAEELVAGLHCVAAPVLDGAGRAVASIGVSIPSARLEPAGVTRTAALVFQAAAEASRVARAPEEVWRSGRLRAAWSMATLRQEAYQIVYQTVERFSAEAGVDVLWADARNDANKQAADVARMLELRPDVILIHPEHALLAEQLFTQASRAGVPAINFQRPVRGRDIPFFVGGNTYEQGRMTAAFVARALAGQGAIAIIGGDPSNDNARNLAQGIYDELRDYPGLRVVSDQPCMFWSRERARELAEAIVREHGATLGALIVANDDMAGGVAEVLAAHGLARKVLLVGGDGDLDALRRIRTGIQHGTAFQDWVALARETLQFAITVARQEVDLSRLQHRSLFYSPPGPPAYVLDLPYIFADQRSLGPLEQLWDAVLEQGGGAG